MPTQVRPLGTDETLLVGRWRETPAGIRADEICARIEALTSSLLEHVAIDDSGWDMLYRDPNDHRFWELTYPESESHGGGPPTLAVVTAQYARQKYGDRIGI